MNELEFVVKPISIVVMICKALVNNAGHNNATNVFVCDFSKAPGFVNAVNIITMNLNTPKNSLQLIQIRRTTNYNKFKSDAQ